MSEETKKRRKPDAARKRNNLTFRANDALRDAVGQAATANNRSVSEQIEHYVWRAIEWEKILGEQEAFKARMAAANAQTEIAQRHRDGWGKRYDPVTGEVQWFPPGTHNIPQSGFFGPQPAQPTLPPLAQELITAQINAAVGAAVEAAIKRTLEEVGVLPKKKQRAA